MSALATLTIGEIAVRQLDGLFSLNDLHKAAGGEAKHQPALFMRMEQTQSLIAEIGNSTDSQSFKTKEGRNGGTYACRELVIAYAAWISAAFHLKVIRVFLAVATPTTPYSVQPGQTLSAEQAQYLRTMLTDYASRWPKNKQGTFMMQGWSKLKAHFKTDYRRIPADQYMEAVNILARHIGGWLIEYKQVETTSAPVTLHDASRTRAAFDAAAQAAASVQTAVFNAVLSGNDEWKYSRWMLAFIDDSAKGSPAYVRQLEHGAFVTTWPRLVRDVGTGECMCTTAELLDMAYACMQRLAQRGATAKLAA